VNNSKEIDVSFPFFKDLFLDKNVRISSILQYLLIEVIVGYLNFPGPTDMNVRHYYIFVCLDHLIASSYFLYNKLFYSNCL